MPPQKDAPANEHVAGFNLAELAMFCKGSQETPHNDPAAFLSSHHALALPHSNPIWHPFRGGSDYYFDTKLGRHLRWNDPLSFWRRIDS